MKISNYVVLSDLTDEITGFILPAGIIKEAWVDFKDMNNEPISEIACNKASIMIDGDWYLVDYIEYKLNVISMAEWRESQIDSILN
jgi:hypothetical protein